MSGIFDDSDEDMFDEESEENNISADSAPTQAETPARAPDPARARRPMPSEGHGPRRLRIRPMPPSMQAKYPNTVSCILTQSDGRQIVLVRK